MTRTRTISITERARAACGCAMLFLVASKCFAPFFGHTMSQTAELVAAGSGMALGLLLSARSASDVRIPPAPRPRFGPR